MPDVSAQRLAELRQHEQWFDRLVGITDEAVLIASSDLSAVEYVSPAYEEVLGQTIPPTADVRDALLARVHPDDRGTCRSDLDGMVADFEAGTPDPVYEWEYRLDGSGDGVERIGVAWHPVTEGDAVEQVVAVVEEAAAPDRTRHERTIRQLHESTERIQNAKTIQEVCEAAVDAASEVLDLSMPTCWLVDGEGALEPVAASEAAWNLPGGPGRFEQGSFEYELFERGETRVYDPSERWDRTPLELAILVPLGDHGLLGVADPGVAEYDDATLDAARTLGRHATAALDRVARARERRESERRLRTVLERIDDAVLLTAESHLSGSPTETDYLTSGHEAIWGRTYDRFPTDEEGTIGIAGTVVPEDREEYLDTFEAVVEAMDRRDSSGGRSVEYRIERPDGSVRWVQSDFYPLVWTESEQRLVIVSRDVTERKRTEQRLEVFNRVLRHNLRNQLDVVRSHAEVLGEETDGEHARQILESAGRLAVIGNRARTIDRMASRDRQLSTVDPPALLERAVEASDASGEVTVTTEIPGALSLVTDEWVLSRVLESALGNALRYADSAITVTVTDQSGGCAIVVETDGPGMPADELAALDAGTETSLQHSRGLLGLWQMKWGVDRLDGSLSVETGDGTILRITVPDHSDGQAG